MYRHLFVLSLGLSGCGAVDDQARDEQAGCAPWESGLMIGTPQSDEIWDVTIDSQGNVYLAGYENGTTGVTSLEPSGNARGVVFKYSPSGQQLNKFSVESSGTSTIEALALDPQSNTLYLAGRTIGALPGFTNQGQYDLVLGWLQGDTWQATLSQWGGVRPEHPRRLSLGLGDQLIIAGYEDIYIPTNYVEAWENPFVTSFQRNGNSLTQTWQHTLDTPSGDAYSGLATAQASDGSIYVTGHRDGGADRGMSVTKFDSQGSELWTRQITGIAYDNGAALHVVSNGDLLLAASTFAQLGDRYIGQMDVVVLKLSADNGDTLWAGQYGSTETDWVMDMAVDEKGQIYLTGETLGVMETGQSNADGSAAFLIKLAASGEELLVKQWSSEGTDIATSIAVDACERAFVAGYTTGELAGANQGGIDGFVLAMETRESL